MYRRIVEAKHFMDQNFKENIDLDKISDQANFSKFHFLRIFKSAFGMSPYQYLTELRLKQAKELLKDENRISTVCFELGFESIQSFSKLFKKHFAESPSSYQKRLHTTKVKMESNPRSFIPSCFAESYNSLK